MNDTNSLASHRKGMGMSDIRKLFYRAPGIDGRWIHVDQAQNILNDYLDKHAKTVYSGGPLGSCSWDYFLLRPDHPTIDYQALLIDIKPIEKLECKHNEVQIYDVRVGELAFRCIGCKKMVQPKNGWEAADDQKPED